MRTSLDGNGFITNRGISGRVSTVHRLPSTLPFPHFHVQVPERVRGGFVGEGRGARARGAAPGLEPGGVGDQREDAVAQRAGFAVPEDATARFGLDDLARPALVADQAR